MLKVHLMVGVAGKTCEGAVEVAGGGAPPRELLYHVKVVLFHLSLACVSKSSKCQVRISYLAISAWDDLPLLHDKDILARL